MEYGELDQYILIKNIEKITEWHNAFEKDNNPYNNLIMIQSSNPDVTLNRILNCNKDVYLFFNNLTSIQKAALMPKLELYYITPKNEYKELKFRNFPDFEEFRNFATNTKTEFSFNENEREDGAGLKKITISDKNQNPGTVNLECKIELFFDNVLALTNSSILELIKTPEIRSAKSESKFRIKLVAGWQTPTDLSNEIFSTEQLEFIEKSNVVYLLSLVKHDLSFNQNGSVSLTVFYQGALEKYLATSPDTDIFALSSPGKINKFLADLATSGKPDYLEEYTKESLNKIAYETAIDFISQTQLSATAKHNLELGNEESETTTDRITSELNTDAEKKINDLEEKLGVTLKRLSELEMIAIKDKYSRIMKALNTKKRLFFLSMEGSAYNAIQAAQSINSKFFNTIEPTFSNGYQINNFGVSVDQTALEALQRNFNAINAQFLQKIEEAGGNEEKLNELTTEYFSKYDNQVVLTSQVPVRQIGDLRHGSQPLDASVTTKKIITYTTLGDIINIVRSFIDISDGEGVELVLGPCILGKFSINIANFPIAISTFMIWFVNTVVRQARRKYQFWEFIYDIIGALVKPALLGVGLIPEESVNLNLKTAITISDTKLEKGGVYLDQGHLHFLSKNVFNTKNIYSYMILYMKDYELTKRDGILKEDLEDGIYHFGIGRDRGIVKNIDFAKIDFARLRDMRITTEGFNNVGDLLREHYDMTIKAIGSPLFIVGAQAYFDGSYLGEAGKNITERLGLGGYYLVTGLETTISKDLFESDVKCTWTSMRYTVAEGYKRLDKRPTEEVK